MSKKNPLIFILALFISGLISFYNADAQELPGNNGENPVFIDTIETSENLLDSNEVYKKQFEELSEDGDWIKVKKSDFLRDLTEETGENLQYYYTEDGAYIFVWRPHGTYEGWNPYYNGSWFFSYYGWTWISNYSWGWGPYHYGRWYFSNFYGWIWMPGNVWAANWVTWRDCGSYYGWYPTCPRVYWRGHGNRWHRNKLYTYKTQNWVIVQKSDFTKRIDEKIVEDPVDNINILQNSVKVKTTQYSDANTKTFKYSGPDVKTVSKEANEKITPKNIEIKNPVTIRNEGNTKVTKKNDVNSTGNEKYNPPPVKSGDVKNDKKPEIKTRESKGQDTKNYNPPKNPGTKNNPPNNPGTKNNPPVRKDNNTKRSNEKSKSSNIETIESYDEVSKSVNNESITGSSNNTGSNNNTVNTGIESSKVTTDSSGNENSDKDETVKTK
ncbi:MAG: hypothetical protein IPM96_00630 [Ignavibacteria bacterium]|nr:hypothetical protein [Ignavibacteria bacterium]